MPYANNVDQDQTAPAVWSGSSLFAIQLSPLRDIHKKQNLSQESME